MRWWQIRRPCLFVLRVWLSYQLLTANHLKGCVNNLLPNSNDQNPSFTPGEMFSWSTLVHFLPESLIHRSSSLLQKISICTDLCNNSWKHFSSGRYVTIVREVKRWQSYQHPLQNLKRGVVWGCERISYHGFKWLLVFHLTGPPYSQCQNGKELQLTRDARTWHVFI